MPGRRSAARWGHDASSLVTGLPTGAAVRGRPASGTSQAAVEALTRAVGLTVPGAGEVRDDRVAGPGPLQGC